MTNALVNDLDLHVYDPDGAQYFPWTLDPADPAAAAVRDQADHINNIEQVLVENPVSGLWRVEVYGYDVPQGSQSFSIGASPHLTMDCDSNNVADDQQIAADPSLDCTGNGILDVCEDDCNGNSQADSCDIAGGVSLDCNSNGIPDECEEDCNGNGSPDECDLDAGLSQDCNGNGVPDECEVNEDCNNNGLQDICDIAAGYSSDWNENGVPDECEQQGNVFYVEDCRDEGSGTSEDPFCKIQYGIAAALPGDTVIVRDGVYTGYSNIKLNFMGKDITLRSENGPANCIIDGGDSHRGIVFQNGEKSRRGG